VDKLKVLGITVSDTLTFHNHVDAVVDKNSSGDEIANVNFYAVGPKATRIR